MGLIYIVTSKKQITTKPSTYCTRCIERTTISTRVCIFVRKLTISILPAADTVIARVGNLYAKTAFCQKDGVWRWDSHAANYGILYGETEPRTSADVAESDDWSRLHYTPRILCQNCKLSEPGWGIRSAILKIALNDHRCTPIKSHRIFINPFASTTITWHVQYPFVNVSFLLLRYEYGARGESRFARYPHCYVMWRFLTTGMVASQCPSPVVKGCPAPDVLPHTSNIGVFKSAKIMIPQ